ncbi:MAG: glycosyltransferase [Candidatus Bipolaricaulia bacterium]
MSAHPSHVSLFWTGLWGGGAERVMLTLAEEFLERGVETDIVLTTTEGELADEVPSGAQVVDLEASRILTSLPGLIRYLRRRRPPVLLSAMRTTNCIALWARALSGVSTRIVVSEHNVLSASTSQSEWKNRVLFSLMRFTYPSADRTVAVSEGVAEDLCQSIGLRREAITTVHNPILDPGLVEQAREHVDHPWFSAGSDSVVLGVGELCEQKDFSTLLRAFARVGERRPAYLAILGEGDKRPALEREARRLGISDRLWMPGFTSNPLKYMAQASVFVLSSKWEGLPTVLIEAMATGTPVVSTNCRSGPAEILKDGEYGRLVPVGDPSALAVAIEEALEGRVQPAPRSALDRFRRDTVADQYLDILSTVV